MKKALAQVLLGSAWHKLLREYFWWKLYFQIILLLVGLKYASHRNNGFLSPSPSWSVKVLFVLLLFCVTSYVDPHTLRALLLSCLTFTTSSDFHSDFQTQTDQTSLQWRYRSQFIQRTKISWNVKAWLLLSGGNFHSKIFWKIYY